MNVKAFLSIANRSLQNTIAYRTSYIITFASNGISFLSLYLLWKAIYNGRELLSGMAWEQMKAYLLISFIANSLLSWYSETRVSGKIRDGSVAVDLLKPLDFQKARLAETLGSSVVEGGLGTLVIALIVIAAAGVALPHSPLALMQFLFSLVGALLVKFGVVYIAGLFCFWTTGSLGVVWTRIAITNLFSGALVPIVFFPDWLQRIAWALPFQSIVNTPASIYMGNSGTAEAFRLIGMQWVWAAVLWVIGKWMWTWAVRKITIHGG